MEKDDLYRTLIAAMVPPQQPIESINVKSLFKNKPERTSQKIYL